MLLKAFLARSGHSIVEAGNGQEAIESFDRENPDLVLMDVTMPIMSGYEAASAIKQRSSKRFIPIIFLTGLDDDESLAKCVASGGDDFLVKPFNSVLLGAKINSMQRIQNLHAQLERYQQQTEQEIELARYVFDKLTKRTKIESVPGLESWILAAGHFSGDMLLYDRSPSGKLYLMLGDFTGHGFSAAIGALLASDIFYAMTRRDFSSADILVEINRKLRSVLPTGHFCATGFVCCDPATRKVETFNGGLPPLRLLSANGKVKEQVNSSNMALGVLGKDDFVPEIEILNEVANGTLVLCSDGLTEAQNGAGEMFGEQRLEAILTATKVKGQVESVRNALQQFIGNREPDDDISLITLKF
jgi:serine phosphatase RsbU (regulator of sigma subunit)